MQYARLYRETAGPDQFRTKPPSRDLVNIPDSEFGCGGDKVQWSFVEQCVHHHKGGGGQGGPDSDRNRWLASAIRGPQ